jgi:hypothetical protein
MRDNGGARPVSTADLAELRCRSHAREEVTGGACRAAIQGDRVRARETALWTHRVGTREQSEGMERLTAGPADQRQIAADERAHTAEAHGTRAVGVWAARGQKLTGPKSRSWPIQAFLSFLFYFLSSLSQFQLQFEFKFDFCDKLVSKLCIPLEYDMR